MNPKFIVSFSTIASLTRKLSLSLLMIGYLITPAWGVKSIKSTAIKPEIIDIDDDGEQVTLHVKVTGEKNKPITDLSESDFQLKVVDLKSGKTYLDKDLPIDNIKLPKETTPPDAWIVVLIDFSGSMNCSLNLKKKCYSYAAKGQRKLDAAIKALQTFIESASKRKGNTQVSIIPFGKQQEGICDYPDKITQKILDNFSFVKDVKLTNFLDELANRTPCAKTNLYQPLRETIKFLGAQENTQFYPKDDKGNLLENQPRLSIILLSDGYDNDSTSDEIKKTLASLQRNKRINVHTLGYGLTPQELGEKYKLGRPAIKQDINSERLSEKDRKALGQEFVEPNQLAQIANLSGGITDFAGDADEISEKLELFLDAIQGQYEIPYTQPNTERDRKIKVQVFAQNIPSKFKEHTLKGFGRKVPLQVRMLMLSSIFIALILGGILPFYLWGRRLKERAKEN